MTSPKPSPVTQALFETVEQRWDDSAVHESFLNACAEENDLAYAARKYREQRDSSNEARHERAEQQLAKITSMAFCQLAAHKTQPSDSKKIFTLLAALVSGGLILACVYLLTL